MSIHDAVNELCRQGHLHPLVPGLLRVPKKRTMVVTTGINDRIEGRSIDEAHRMRWAGLRARLMEFVHGDVVRVRMRKPQANDPTHMARLDNASDEVWELRYVKGDEAISVFGRFAGQDFFIALQWHAGPVLGYESAPQLYTTPCKTEWSRLLPDWAAFSAKGYPDDYLTDAMPL